MLDQSRLVYGTPIQKLPVSTLPPVKMRKMIYLSVMIKVFG